MHFHICLFAAFLLLFVWKALVNALNKRILFPIKFKTLITLEANNIKEAAFNSLDTDAPPYDASAVGRRTRMRHLLAHQH